ncbi:hypothetical protein [Robiginitalea sp. SC105]|uniref:hypothetical protein n=1 Tax=Robiginitalea sp. SC105 TaxID=2762332 RepID=UPI001639D9F3|nr:hypothetical protein [Robiginitalea sp. SC105]MBC2840532.1 hypothetical protein [Robiginitalea sp. SC105]
MKRICCAVCCCMGFFGLLQAQTAPQLDSIQRAEAEAGPVMLEFQPEHHVLNSLRRIRMDELKAQLDTLDIPEARRYRIMRDAYRGKESRLLVKYLQADQAAALRDPEN